MPVRLYKKARICLSKQDTEHLLQTFRSVAFRRLIPGVRGWNQEQLEFSPFTVAGRTSRRKKRKILGITVFHEGDKTDARRFVIKTGEREDVEAEERARQHLTDGSLAQGIKVIAPVYTDVDNGFVIYPYAEGETAQRHFRRLALFPLPGNRARICRLLENAAVWQATFHSQCRQGSLPEVDDATRWLDRYSLKSVIENGFPGNDVSKYKLRYRATYDKTRTTLCHGDPHLGNTLLNRKGLYLMDWKRSVWGDPLQDLVKLCQTTLSDYRRAPVGRRFSVYSLYVFLDTYHRHAQLQPSTFDYQFALMVAIKQACVWARGTPVILNIFHWHTVKWLMRWIIGEMERQTPLTPEEFLIEMKEMSARY